MKDGLQDNEKNAFASFVEEFKALSDNKISYFKQLNKPVMGWCNTYVPEEIIMAAGFHPYRVMGAPIALSVSKAYMSGNICSSVQSILECEINGEYSFLEGMIIGASTEATKRLYDAWSRYAKTPFCHFFDIPKFINEAAITHYTQSAYLLIEEIENKFKIKISDPAIKDAILICNKTRKLLTGLSDLRKLDNSPITSQQFLEICKLGMICDKSDFNNSLEKFINKIGINSKEKSKKYRIMITGSFQDQSWLLDVIGQRNAMVVCEDSCNRLRYFIGLVDMGTDLIKSIAERYLKAKPASANLVSFDQRADYLLRLIKDFKVDGVIYYVLKFDDPYLFEFPDMKSFLDKQQVPVLRIETEHSTSAIGQVTTRVQAFVETLKLAKLRSINASFTK